LPLALGGTAAILGIRNGGQPGDIILELVSGGFFVLVGIFFLHAGYRMIWRFSPAAVDTVSWALSWLFAGTLAALVRGHLPIARMLPEPVDNPNDRLLVEMALLTVLWWASYRIAKWLLTKAACQPGTPDDPGRSDPPPVAVPPGASGR
jgi:hypothetical protein